MNEHVKTVLLHLVSLLALLAVLAFSVTKAEASEAGYSKEWKSFVLHIREGEVDEFVQGGKCLGRDKNGEIRTVGCARRTAAAPEAWLDGECWITVRSWDPAIIAAVLKNWGHELAHCVGKKHDEKGIVWHE